MWRLGGNYIYIRMFRGQASASLHKYITIFVSLYVRSELILGLCGDVLYRGQIYIYIDKEKSTHIRVANSDDHSESIDMHFEKKQKNNNNKKYCVRKKNRLYGGGSELTTHGN